MMIRNLTNSCFVFLALVLTSYLTAQEQLVPLSGHVSTIYSTSKKSNSTKKIQSVVSDTIPFFDDFSYAYKSPYPSAKWIDSSAYINTGFAIAPPTLGVATFDGLNKEGYPYNISAPFTSSTNADYLTSRPINIEKKGNYTYSPADSIYLSFYYQPEGLGDAPEANDSLIVEFYKPQLQQWVKVWGQKGTNPDANDSTFYQAIIPILDIAYFDSLFQFRFKNKATTSGSLDHWSIDYVYLNKDRKMSDDPFLEDVAFAYMPKSFLKNYTAMPYEQFVASEMALSFSNYIRNNHTQTKQETYSFSIYDKNNTLLLPTVNQGACNANTFLPNNGYVNCNQHANPSIGYIFPTPLTDTTYFNIAHVLNVTTDLVRANDTVIQRQNLWNYYAYDDGGAEVGYYLNTYGAYTALRFTLNNPDTLRALDLFFDPIINGTLIQTSGFRISVWNDISTQLGNRVYKDSIMYPTYVQGDYNLIPRYALTSGLPLAPGTYYIGIQQVTNQALNIGFDRNNDYHSALYYNVGSGWQQSSIAGALMMRPVFGRASFALSVNEPLKTEKRNTFFVYPNPAKDKLHISSSSEPLRISDIELYNNFGQLVKQLPFEEDIDVSDLQEGFYYLVIKNNSLLLDTKKIIISH